MTINKPKLYLILQKSKLSWVTVFKMADVELNLGNYMNQTPINSKIEKVDIKVSTVW